MARKRGFTLIELMAALAISTIALTMIGSIYLQGYKLLMRTENKAVIQNEIRNAIMNIESEASDASNIEIRKGDSITKFEGKDAKEVVVLKKPNEEIVYFEVVIDYENKQNQFIKVKYGQDGLIEKNILINNIKPNEGQKFALISEKIESLINIDFSGVAKGNYINNKSYICTLSNKSDDININLFNNESDNSINENNGNNRGGQIDANGWNQTIIYKAGDRVIYEEKVYEAEKENLNISPGHDSNNKTWRLFN